MSQSPDRRVVNVGGRTLEYSVTAKASPFVVFESGAGLDVSEWDQIRSQLGDQTSSIAYSRAGQGGSEPPLADSLIFDDGHVQVATAESRTNDLAELLEQADTKPPFILVGHSLGGIYIRLFAQRFPQFVAGLVFIDSTHPDQVNQLREAIRGSELSDETMNQLLSEAASPNAPVINAARDTGPFNDLPIAVLSRDTSLPIVEAENAAPIKFQQIFNGIWDSLQTDIARLSSDSTHKVIAGSDHLLHRQFPEAVVAAINSVIDRSGAFTISNECH